MVFYLSIWGHGWFYTVPPYYNTSYKLHQRSLATLLWALVIADHFQAHVRFFHHHNLSVHLNVMQRLTRTQICSAYCLFPGASSRHPIRTAGQPKTSSWLTESPAIRTANLVERVFMVIVPLTQGIGVRISRPFARVHLRFVWPPLSQLHNPSPDYLRHVTYLKNTGLACSSGPASYSGGCCVATDSLTPPPKCLDVGFLYTRARISEWA